MPLKTLTPDAAHQLLGNGALLVDIRAPDEHARERIAQAVNQPLSGLTQSGALGGTATAVIFHCRSGQRTQMNAQLLETRVLGDGYLLEGGLDAWKRAGLPTVVDAGQPLELQRQVQIAAGGLALTGTLLGTLVSPWFYVMPGFVGAGLLFAGISGFCGMARLLVHAPWNRRPIGH